MYQHHPDSFIAATTHRSFCDFELFNYYSIFHIFLFSLLSSFNTISIWSHISVTADVTSKKSAALNSGRLGLHNGIPTFPTSPIKTTSNLAFWAHHKGSTPIPGGTVPVCCCLFHPHSPWSTIFRSSKYWPALFLWPFVHWFWNVVIYLYHKRLCSASFRG